MQKSDAEMICAYLGGDSMREVGLQFGCHPQTVLNKLRSHGIPSRPKLSFASEEDREEHFRKYHEDHRSSSLEYHKNYYLENKEAHQEYGRNYYTENKEHILRRTKRNGKRRRDSGLAAEQHRRFKYGLSRQEYEDMLASRDGLCDICSVEMRLSGHRKDSVCVDHCHDSGEVRGLLCNACNRSLGGFQDDSEIVQRAADYLQRHDA